MRPKKWDIPSASASSATTSLGGFFSKKDWPGTFSPEFHHMFSRFSICSPDFLQFQPDFPRCHVFTAAPHTFPTWPWSHCGAPTFHFQCGHRHRAAQPSSMIFLKSIMIFQGSVELPEGTYIFIFAYMYIYIYICMCIYTWTVLEPHNFRSLWIFGCGPKNHFWAKSDGFNDTVLVSKSWSFASVLRHFASYFWLFQMWLKEGKISNCSIFGRSLLFSPDQKNAAFGCPGIYIYIYINRERELYIFCTKQGENAPTKWVIVSVCLGMMSTVRHSPTQILSIKSINIHDLAISFNEDL